MEEAPAPARLTGIFRLVANFPEVKKRLACFDIFSGCGGFSEGLKQAGVIDCKWAVEENPSAAKAFKENNPEATVFQEDCEELLKKAKQGLKKNFFSGQQIPAKGEVELLSGGPPCQVI